MIIWCIFSELGPYLAFDIFKIAPRRYIRWKRTFVWWHQANGVSHARRTLRRSNLATCCMLLYGPVTTRSVISSNNNDWQESLAAHCRFLGLVPNQIMYFAYDYHQRFIYFIEQHSTELSGVETLCLYWIPNKYSILVQVIFKICSLGWLDQETQYILHAQPVG